MGTRQCETHRHILEWSDEDFKAITITNLCELGVRSLETNENLETFIRVICYSKSENHNNQIKNKLLDGLNNILKIIEETVYLNVN